MNHLYCDYTAPLGPGTRKRIKLWRSGQAIVNYRVQLETQVGNEWVTVIGFDPKHDGPHIDVYHLDGTDKDLEHRHYYDILKGYEGAVLAAENEIERHWEIYKHNFLNGRWPR